MAFNTKKFPIDKDYIKKGNARSGRLITKVGFIVAHDTGDSGATAQNEHDYFNNQQPSASAHTFIDDKVIKEIIPVDKPEKAWHVLYQKPTDNKMFGDDANDIAIGVELCFGGKIDFSKAYEKYVWYLAYLCHKFGLKPDKHIVSHKILDPERKIDPDNALNRYGKTYKGLLADVLKEYNSGSQPVYPGVLKQGSTGADVKLVQKKLGIGADGIFGSGTKRAVVAFQKEHDLVADGIIGKLTWNTLF